jgi:hypothetical protein
MCYRVAETDRPGLRDGRLNPWICVISCNVMRILWFHLVSIFHRWSWPFFVVQEEELITSNKSCDIASA